MKDFMLNSKSTIDTGSKAVRGALRNTFTQGSNNSSIRRFLTINILTIIPITTA